MASCGVTIFQVSGFEETKVILREDRDPDGFKRVQVLAVDPVGVPLEGGCLLTISRYGVRLHSGVSPRTGLPTTWNGTVRTCPVD